MRCSKNRSRTPAQRASIAAHGVPPLLRSGKGKRWTRHAPAVTSAGVTRIVEFHECLLFPKSPIFDLIRVIRFGVQLAPKGIRD